MKKRMGALAVALSLLAGTAAPATAAPDAATDANTPPVIHVPSGAREWPSNRLLPWRDGVTATDAEDGDISHKLVLDSPFPYRSDRPGDPDNVRFQVVSVTDSDGATTNANYYYTVIPWAQWRTDNKPPVLVAGARPVTICRGQSYNPLNHVRFDDDYDGRNIGLANIPPGAQPQDGRIYPGVTTPGWNYPYGAEPQDSRTYPGVTTPDGERHPFSFAGDRVDRYDFSYVFADSDGAKTDWITITVNVLDCGSGPVPPKHGFFLNYHGGPYADLAYAYGRTTDEAYVGDWDGNGTDTIALRRGNTFYINNRHDSTADYTIRYGRPGDTMLVGDWDGNGTDTFAVRRGKTYHVKNRVTGGDADHVVNYGRAGDDVLVGDWDGDRKDTFAVRRGSVYHVKNRIAGGDADRVINYGRRGDDVYVGDWNGDRKDTFAVRRGRTYYISNTMRGGGADRVLVYGRKTDTTIVGDWDGDGVDTLGIRR